MSARGALRRRFRVLMAAAELYPLVKAGGLGDAVAALASSLARRDLELKVVIPGYGPVLDRLEDVEPLRSHRLKLRGAAELGLIEYRPPELGHDVWVLTSDELFRRPGTPYEDESGKEWPDNAERFGTFCRVTAALALGAGDTRWKPDLVHCHDWHTGLVPALLSRSRRRPATVFNIHSLAHQGVYQRADFEALALDESLWSLDGLEFHGAWSFLKGGLAFADRLVTVSPTYAREIVQPAHGLGLEGVLRHRASVLEGILNGADYRVWNPRTDRFIDHHFDVDDLGGKVAAKRSLQRYFGLPEEPRAFLLGHVGRLSAQKGTDLLLEALPDYANAPGVQLVVLGSGEPPLESEVRATTRRYPGTVAAHVGYSEPLAHRIIAGADAFLMPSRFEPCGLTQLYALAYGTVPIVHGTGGLADTVVDATAANVDTGTATGFVFDALSGLAAEISRARRCFERTPDIWFGIQRAGMLRDFGWERSAAAYLAVYRDAVRRRIRATGSRLPV